MERPDRCPERAAESESEEGRLRHQLAGAVKTLERIAEAGETASQPLPQMMGRVAQQALDNLQPGGQ